MMLKGAYDLEWFSDCYSLSLYCIIYTGRHFEYTHTINFKWILLIIHTECK